MGRCLLRVAFRPDIGVFYPFLPPVHKPVSVALEGCLVLCSAPSGCCFSASLDEAGKTRSCSVKGRSTLKKNTALAQVSAGRGARPQQKVGSGMEGVA